MYSLYIDKKEKAIDVNDAKQSVLNRQEFKKEITQYNRFIYLCLDKEPLLEMAKEIKEKWVSEAEAELEEVKKIDLNKPKYTIV